MLDTSPKLNTSIFLLIFITLFNIPYALAKSPKTITEVNSGSLPYESRFVDANGISINYLDWGGTGDVVLLLAGFNMDAHAFDEFAPRFTDHFRVLSISRRGFGDSSKPSTGYDIETRAADILAFIDNLGFDRVSIIGHSMAGDEMTEFATHYPDRVKTLVYLDAAYDRTLGKSLALNDPALPPVWRRLILESRNSPDAKEVIVKKMPPQNIWSIGKACIKAMESYKPDYTKIEARSLAIYATPEHNPESRPGMEPEFLESMEDFWHERMAQSIRPSIEKFRREAKFGKVVELREANHFIFMGNTQDKVIRLSKKFLLQNP